MYSVMNAGEMTHLEVNHITNSYNSIFRIYHMHTKQKWKKMQTRSRQKINICNTRKCAPLECYMCVKEEQQFKVSNSVSTVWKIIYFRAF